jgi:Zn-dependent protease
MFLDELRKDPAYYFAMLFTITLSVTLHELAHGVVAVMLGDDTPIREGRMTLNPLVHMGKLSLAMLAIAGIAWGQMPVREDKLRGRFGVALVAAAGPAMNVLIGLIALVSLGLWIRFDTRTADELPKLLYAIRYLLPLIGIANFMLAIFNLLPVPPLDGSNIARSLFPAVRNAMYAMRQTPIVFLIIFFFAGQFIFPWSIRLATKVVVAVRGS